MKDEYLKKSLGYRLKKSIPAYLFIAPLIILISVFSYYPAVSGIFHSFFDWRQAGEAKQGAGAWAARGLTEDRRHHDAGALRNH